MRQQSPSGDMLRGQLSGVTLRLLRSLYVMTNSKLVCRFSGILPRNITEFV